MENVILECRQQLAEGVYDNGDWDTRLAKPVAILEGDTITINKSFIDTQDQNDGKINIEEDINLKLTIRPYLTNWKKETDMVFSTNTQNEDGQDYYMTTLTEANDPVLLDYKIATTVTFVGKGFNLPKKEQNDGAPYQWGGVSAVLEHLIVGPSGQPVTTHTVIPIPVLHQDHGRNASYTATNLNIMVKSYGTDSFGNEIYFKVSNVATLHTANTQDDAEAGGFQIVQDKTFVPLSQTKEFIVREGKYDPADFCTLINNELSKQENIDSLGFAEKDAMDNPFMLNSADAMKRTTEDQQTIIDSIVTNSTDKSIKVVYSGTGRFTVAQQVTLANIPAGLNIGNIGTPIAGNTLNGLQTITAVSFDPTATHKNGSFTFLSTGTQPPEDEEHKITIPIDSLIFTASTNEVQVKITDDTVYSVPISGTPLMISGFTGTFGGVDIGNKISGVSHTIVSHDIVARKFVIAMAAPNNVSSASGTVLATDTDTPKRVVLVATPVPIALPTIDYTQVLTDTRFLMRTDGKMAFSITTPTSAYWVGASQIELSFDGNTNLFSWKNLHLPLLNNADVTAKVVANSGGGSTAFFWAIKNSGVAFSNLEAFSVKTGDQYDFWSGKLGFNLFPKTDPDTGKDIPALCIVSNQEQLIGFGDAGETINRPVYSNLGDGVSTVGQRPTIDSLIVKNQPLTASPNFRNPPADPSTLSSTSELTTQITAPNVAIESDLLRFGYFFIRLRAGFTSEMVSEGGITEDLIGIINRYYSLGSFTSSEGSTLIYTHKGSPIYLNDIRITILDSTKQLAPELGDDNTVFIAITRGEASQQPYLTPAEQQEEDREQMMQLKKQDRLR